MGDQALFNNTAVIATSALGTNALHELKAFNDNTALGSTRCIASHRARNIGDRQRTPAPTRRRFGQHRDRQPRRLARGQDDPDRHAGHPDRDLSRRRLRHRAFGDEEDGRRQRQRAARDHDGRRRSERLERRRARRAARREPPPREDAATAAARARLAPARDGGAPGTLTTGRTPEAL